MKKKILITVGAVALLAIAAVGFAGWKISQFVSSFGEFRRTPAAVEPRIVTGADFLVRSDFFKVPEGSLNEAIRRGATAPDEKTAERVKRAEIAKNIYEFADLAVIDGKVYAAAEFGGYVLDAGGNLEREFAFEPLAHEAKILGFSKTIYIVSLDDVQIVTLAPGRVGYCSTSPTDGFTVFDEKGDIVWNYGRRDVDLGELSESPAKAAERRDKERNVLEGTVGDLDGDGVAEYVVAVENDGVHAFKADGRELWFAPDEFPSSPLRVADIDADGAPEIVELSAKAKVRDAGGSVERTMKIGGHDTGQLIVRDGRFYDCDLYRGRLTCDDQDKTKLFDAEAPLSFIPKTPAATPEMPSPTPIRLDDGTAIVPDPFSSSGSDGASASYPKIAFAKLRKGEPPYLAVVAHFIGGDRAVFYVYDAKGALRYQEVLDAEAETIAVLTAANGSDEILIGGRNTIWRFAVK